MKNFGWTFAILLVGVGAAWTGEASAANCYLEGSGANYASPMYLTGVYNPGGVPPTIDFGRTVSGGSCVVLGPSTDINVSQTAIWLGKGVTFDGNGKTINCTSSSRCAGAAIATAAASRGTGATTVTNTRITGCWDSGLANDVLTTPTTAQAVTVEFPSPRGSTCQYPVVFNGNTYMFNSAMTGIGGFRDVNWSRITRANGSGVFLYQNNSAVSDTLVTDSQAAINVDGYSTGLRAVNVLSEGNDMSVTGSAGGSTRVDSQGSVFQGVAGAGGHCGNNDPLGSCLTFSGTRASFVEQVLY